jgi:hypothetical protein
MRKLLLLLASCLAAGCGQQGAPGNGQGKGTAPPRGPVQTVTLTGLYESEGAGPGQLCITEQGGRARFGLVSRREGPGCSGAGTASRAGQTLRLVMDGDSPCAIEARLAGGRVTFPASLPQGCSYYCAPGAAAGGLVLSKTGGTREDALRARDLVGGPLCA